MSSQKSIPAKPSSSTSGFFQPFPTLEPQYTSPSSSNTSTQTSPPGDTTLSHALSLYLPTRIPPTIDQSLHSFARQCLHPSTLHHTLDAELHPPRLNPLTTFGQENHTDALWTSTGWRALKAIGTKAGIVALGYRQHPSTYPPRSNVANQTYNRRIHQYATMYLFSGSSALATCPAAMTDGAALLLSRHLADSDGDQPGRGAVLRAARDKLIEFDPGKAWSSGQWMTERSGGSDVSLTETAAVRLSAEEVVADDEAEGGGLDADGMPLGPWRVDGFKWFSSATDSEAVVLLARAGGGISAFFAPMRREGGKLNGVRIVRLKEKLGTRALPTAEVEVRGMRAWLVGAEGEGVREVGAVLNCTRLWTGVGAVGGWGRGLAVARAYSKVRRVKGKLLMDNAQHLGWMAGESVKHRAACHLAFLGVALQGLSEQGGSVVKGTKAEVFLPSDKGEAEILLRVITPVLKAQCSLASVAGLRACMESLGGVGYCENNLDGGFLNIARIFRDTNVNCIWEGTTSIMAEDLVRAVKGKGGPQTLAALERLIKKVLHHGFASYESEFQAIETLWEDFRKKVSSRDVAQLQYDGRKILNQLEIILCSALLIVDANISQDRLATYIAKKYASDNFSTLAVQECGWRETAALDKKVFMGIDLDEAEKLSRL